MRFGLPYVLGAAAMLVAGACSLDVGWLTSGGPPDAGGIDASSARDAVVESSDAAADGIIGYADTVLGDEPLAYWRLGDPPGASTVKDETGHGNDGLITGAVTLGAPGALVGDSDTCASFGDNSWIAVGDKFGFESGVPFSIELWLKPAEVDVWRPVVAKGDYLTFFGGYALLTNGHQPVPAPSIVFLTWAVPDAGSDSGIIYEPLAAAVWTHVVLTFNGSAASFYIGGVLVGGKSIPPFTPSTQPFTIAGPSDGAHGGGSYNGLIDEVAVYGATLSDAAIQRHYQVGTGLSR